jgi:fructose-1,6-bisphosphatase/inositol monophosphatase family enzyme
VQTDWVSERLVEVAGRVVMPRFGALEAEDVEEKQPGDLVTVADKEAEVELAAILTAADPGCLVVGEEGVFTDPRRMEALPYAERAWVIDPVDGTRNFSKGSPDFAVMLAEVRAGTTVRGWIWQPAHARLYVAERGAGVRCNGEPLTAVRVGREPLLGATYLPLPDELAAAVRIRRSWGSCGIDYPKLLAGEVDFLSYRSMFPWDHLPGALMVTESGGRVASTEDTDYRAGVVGRRLVAALSDADWRTARDALVHLG